MSDGTPNLFSGLIPEHHNTNAAPTYHSSPDLTAYEIREHREGHMVPIWMDCEHPKVHIG